MYSTKLDQTALSSGFKTGQFVTQGTFATTYAAAAIKTTDAVAASPTKN